MPADLTATKVRLFVHREANGYLLSASTTRPDPDSVVTGDTVTQVEVWLPVTTKGRPHAR